MKHKIISINRDNLYDIAEKLETLPDIDENVVIVLWFDAKRNELLSPANVIEKFLEQIFPIKIVKYDKIYYVSSIDEFKPVPPNKKEQFESLIKSLLPVDSIVNIST